MTPPADLSVSHQTTERIIGFSVPVEQQIAVISYDGIRVIDLDEPRIVLTDTAHPEGGVLYDQSRQVLTHADKTFHMLGLFGGTPILRNDNGEEVQLGILEDVLHIRNAAQRVVLTFEFEDMSGDWRYATFSPDGATLVLGLPYALHTFRRIP